jgi:hypothetical protein
VTILPLPKGVTELLFDRYPAIPNCVTFSVRVFPETEAVFVYASLDCCPVRCRGTLTYLTVTTNSGRIYVQRLSEYPHFEITIATCIEPRSLVRYPSRDPRNGLLASLLVSRCVIAIRH